MVSDPRRTAAGTVRTRRPRTDAEALDASEPIRFTSGTSALTGGTLIAPGLCGTTGGTTGLGNPAVLEPTRSPDKSRLGGVERAQTQHRQNQSSRSAPRNARHSVPSRKRNTIERRTPPVKSGDLPRTPTDEANVRQMGPDQTDSAHIRARPNLVRPIHR